MAFVFKLAEEDLNIVWSSFADLFLRHFIFVDVLTDAAIDSS
jgi:hypothetical protein